MYLHQVWLAAWLAWTDWSADLSSRTASPAPPSSLASPSSLSSSAASTSTRLHYYHKVFKTNHSDAFNSLQSHNWFEKFSESSKTERDVFTSANVIYKRRPARNCVLGLYRKRLPSQYCLPSFKMPGRTPVPRGLLHIVKLGLQSETDKCINMKITIPNSFFPYFFYIHFMFIAIYPCY